jgi:hypothetical protein
LPLLKELQNFYPGFDDDRLSYEYLYSKLYPGKKFNKQVMWNLNFALERMSEEFIIHETLRHDEFSRQSFLLLGLSDKKIPKYYYKKLRMMKKRFENMEIGEDRLTGNDYFKIKWKYEAVRGVYYQMIDEANLMGDPVKKRGEYLILGFIQNLTQDLYNMYFLERKYNQNFVMNLPLQLVKSIDFKQIIEYIKDKNFEYEWIIEFYFHKIMCLTDNENETHFFNLKKIFEDNYTKFTFFENTNTISTLTNYCIDKIDKGRENYSEILFEINKYRLKKNLITRVGPIFPKSLYIQMINTALAINKNEWARNFIENNTRLIKKEFQKSMGSLAAALLFFNQKQFEKVLQNLNRVDFIDISDKLYVRILSAMSYYELGETEVLIHYIDSSKHFLSQSDDIEIDAKEAYLNFFKYLDKLISHAEDPRKHSYLKLHEKIKVDTGLRLDHKKWLIEKITDLRK